MLVADSIHPGVMNLLVASITFASAGTLTSVPTARILPPPMSTVPFSITAPDTVKIRPLVIAMGPGPVLTATGPDPIPLADGRTPTMVGTFGVPLDAEARLGKSDPDGDAELGSGPITTPVMKSRCGCFFERSYTSAPSMNTRSALA